MNKTTEALKLADKVISRYRNETPIGNQPHMICHIADEALAAIREVLADPVQEPVAWGCRSETDLLVFQNEGQAKCFADKWELVVLPLYAAPVSAEAIRAEDYIKAYQQGRKDMKEEAAKVCDDIGFEDNGYGCAAAIRSME